MSAANRITAVEPANTNDLAIRLHGVTKRYRLGSIGGRTLQADLQSWWARKRGKEDPNLHIGTDPTLLGKPFYALKGIDLEIRQGERVGIIGANGAGKSTMLKLLSRVTAPTDGEIDIWGRVSSMLEVGTGFHWEMTGRENVYMNGAILGMTRAQISERMEQIIDFSEVREFIDTPVKRYSSGMLVKLAFSVAAHLNGDIIIMDEVLAVGDMAFQHKCLERMRHAADEEGRTVLYVSHNMNTIRRLCDRCVMLEQGRIVFDGDVEEGIAAYMNHGIRQTDVDMDLSARERNQRFANSGLFMTRLLLLDKASPVYGDNENLRMALWINTSGPVEDVSFRLTMRTDADVGLGTAWSRDIDLPSEGTHRLELEFPLDTLAKGVFYVSVGLYHTDELGRKITLDHISQAFRMELIGTPVWDTTAYGYLRLPSVHVLDEPSAR
ncbi:MAG: ATP-binding cassette domain-containing protein [Atopobiaceae bacterium]|nr:ATP-binding cassette domain-containing protein [Atopobiaceae bacterium]